MAWMEQAWPQTEVGYKDRALPFPERDNYFNLSVTITDGEIAPEQVSELLNYDPKTGFLTWRTARRGVKVGARAGSVDTNGYRYVPIRKVFYLAQRLAWAHYHGSWPRTVVKFVNDDTDDCSIENLREPLFEYGTLEGRSAYQKDLRKRRPEKFKNQDLKKAFGITLAQYQAMHDAQGGLCAICGKPERATRNGGVKMLAVDHCHARGHIRQLLCASCNTGLGGFGDDPLVLRAAAAYLERHVEVEG